MNRRTLVRMPGIKIEISKLKGAYKDQLAPFEGLWGFTLDLDEYHGTIFRFPLRPRGAQSKLGKNLGSLDCKAVQDYLDKFLEDEGRIALVFLKRIQYMDFKIHGEAEPRWSVKSAREQQNGQFSGYIHCTITKCMGWEPNRTLEDRWFFAMQDLESLPKGLQYRGKGETKEVQCGVAALVSNGEASLPSNQPTPKFFSTLPLPFGTGLPVHIHATFILPSDRASIPIEESMRAAGAEWNKWLLTSAIPHLYLTFLEDFARKSIEPHEYFNLWPCHSVFKEYLPEMISSSFWQLLPRSSCRLFPVPKHIRALRNKKCQAPALIEIKDAIFDLLPESESIALRKVLELLLTDELVRVPDVIREELKFRKIEVKSITPERLRDLFKEESASKCLEEMASKDPNILETLLRMVKPVRDQDFVAMDGCRILPIADGSLGTLSLIDSFKHTNYYYLANEREIELFNFASGLLVRQNSKSAFLEAIMNCKKFNIDFLSLSHVPELLERRDFGNRTPTKETCAWLRQFWKYWREKESEYTNTELGLEYIPGVQHYPIYAATRDGVKTYIMPKWLDILPSVIEPDKPEQRLLCNEFPEIYRLNSSFLPTHLKSTERSLNDPASFTRFIKAVSSLAAKEGKDLEKYIRTHLEPAHLEV